MSVFSGPEIVNSGLVLHLDAANPRSYSGSGTTWYDLTKNTNVSLINNPSYTGTNNGGIVFDGTNDYARPTVAHSYLSSSALEFVFNSSSHGSGFKTIGGYRHNSGYSLPTIGSIYLNGTTLNASVITTSQVYRTAIYSAAILTNRTYHVVLNKDTVNGTLQLFVNGVAGDVQTFDAATYAYWAGEYVGANILDIAKSSNDLTGQSWGNDYFNGTMYKIGLYNRILTLAEIKQNFEAMRGRYGL